MNLDGWGACYRRTGIRKEQVPECKELKSQEFEFHSVDNGDTLVNFKGKNKMSRMI